MTPSSIIHAICGSPTCESCEQLPRPVRCWLCAGEMLRGEPVDSWNGASFTGQNRVRSPASTHVCEPCVFVCSRLSPVPGRPAKEGKKLGGNFRNYSHLWEDGAGYANASKGEKHRVREFLSREHRGIWFAAIADSGQKHVIPWAPMNGPGRGGSVLFDEQIVSVPASLALMDEMTALLTMGATKEELGSGDYSPRAWQLCGDTLRTFDASHGMKRGGAWYVLALWLAQRDEETVQARLAAEKTEKEMKKRAGRKAKGTATNAHGRGAASAARGVPADEPGERAEALGPTSVPDAERVPDVRDAGGMGDDDRAKAPGGDAQRRQLALFG